MSGRFGVPLGGGQPLTTAMARPVELVRQVGCTATDQLRIGATPGVRARRRGRRCAGRSWAASRRALPPPAWPGSSGPVKPAADIPCLEGASTICD